MADYGIKVSKEGFDVLTAADKDLTLKSDINIFKVSADGSGTISASGTETVSHGFAYIPFYLVFMEATSGKMRIANGSGHISSEEFRAYANTSNLVMNNDDSSNTKDFYYYIHYDQQPT